ncbi:MAG: hypothetical protein K9L74_01845 [Candidatus Izimaplasma sp.]|nr:hypothetical protein [Candidatus Izimaplasma bacterium]
MGKPHKNYQKKKYYPKKKNHNNNYPKVRQNPPNIFGGFFNGNLAEGMNFGGKDHELSGFVRREVFMKDKDGNIQKAREEQFFNSSKDPMTIRNRDDNNGRF